MELIKAAAIRLRILAIKIESFRALYRDFANGDTSRPSRLIALKQLVPPK